MAAGAYSGFSDLFECVPGTSTPNSIVNSGPPANSSWSDGTFNASAFGGAGALGAIKIGVPPPAPPPTITGQPTNRTVPAGQSATFSVAATGTAPITYQWQFNGSPISGANSNAYTVFNVQPSNTGPYIVVVSNSGGSTTSAVATLSLAITNDWAGSGFGKWETGTNWSLNVPPGYTQFAYITESGAQTIVLDATTAGAYSNAMTVSNLTLANPGANTSLVVLGSGSGTPLLVLNSLVLDIGGSLSVISNSLLEVDGQTVIGDAGSPVGPGTGLLSINSGVATLASVVLGNVSTSSGISDGVIDLNGGILQISSNLTVAAQSGSTGLVSMTGGTLLVTNGPETIGTNGSGTIVQTGGTNQSLVVALGGGAGSTGSYIITNGALNAGTLYLGNLDGGLGVLDVEGTALVNIKSNVTLVSGSLSTTSTMTLGGGAFVATNGLVQVGPIGRGQIVVTGGSHTMRQLWLGSSNGMGGGSLYVLGGSLRILGTGIGPGQGFVANAMAVALNGDFQLNDTSITIGSNDHNGTASLSDNATVKCAALYVGVSPTFTGTYLQTNNGTMTVSSMMIVGNCVSNATGVVNLNGGTLYVTNADHTAFLDIRSGTFILGSNATLVVDNLIMTNACGLFKISGGNLQAYYPPLLQPCIVPTVSSGGLTLSFQTA
ncbi:MAG TPA: immunoglobulin domain-containing protein, partial [Verrucomicrobiae bacterium]|nr:immunoglobulin domain-containing protein [Verrucomicrobiae bacterium]